MSEGSHTRESKFRPKDYLVGFFGSLVPGILFLVLLIPALVIPILVGIQVCLLPIKEIGAYLGLPALMAQSAIHLELAIVFLVSAYVVGFLFFRQDTKPVDVVSCLIYGDADGPVRFEGKLCEVQAQFKKLPNGLRFLAALVLVPRYAFGAHGKVLKSKVQYPYPDLQDYLSERGFSELAELVSKEEPHRTKHAINRMKIVVNCLEPEMNHAIAQAEAHVRLSSSSWYVCKGLGTLAVLGLCVLGATFFRASTPEHFNAIYLAGGLSFGVLLFTAWFRRQITKAFHYQRIREIIIVLQTYVTVANIHPTARLVGPWVVRASKAAVNSHDSDDPIVRTVEVKPHAKGAATPAESDSNPSAEQGTSDRCDLSQE